MARHREIDPQRPRRGLRESRWDEDEWIARGAVYTPDTDRTGGLYWRSDRRGPHVGRGPRGWTRDVEAIRDEVCQRMAAHGRLDASDVEVTVADGEVTLTGTVPDRAQKRLAEDLADDVSGVRDVHNRLTLRSRRTERAV